MYNAIYYQDAYLLLPPELPEFGAFLADLRSRELPATYRLLPLLEDNRVRHSRFSRGVCMAPCFLTGYRDEPLSVRIDDPSAVYPVQVELLTQEEYNARLCAVVRKCCPGCRDYTPISGNEASLAGRHEEISLNGVCSFRWETRSRPRCFSDDLKLLDAPLLRRLPGLTEQELCKEITLYTGLPVAIAQKVIAPDGAVTLRVQPTKPSPLFPLLTRAAGHYMQSLSGSALRMEPHPLPDLSPEALTALTAWECRSALRKDCRRYGAALAELTWDGQDDGRVAASLALLERKALLSVLHAEAGRAFLLMLNVPMALKELRFRTPLLEAHGAALTVHSATHSRRCTINFDMPFETLD